MERRSIARVTAAASALALGLVGCQQTAPVTDTGEGEFTPDTGAIESVESVELTDFKTIYFDYDSSNLKGKSLSALKKNAAYLKENRDVEVLVAGHCDERGTEEYNLSLAQYRAKEIREYYMRLGVSGKSIATISYGEEKPVCGDSTEDCWWLNRRGETLVRTRTASAGGGNNSR